MRRVMVILLAGMLAGCAVQPSQRADLVPRETTEQFLRRVMVAESRAAPIP